MRRLQKAFDCAVRLRCPRCGKGPLFRGLFTMHDSCSVCQLRFEREPGYFVGAIYINYAVTVLISISGFLLLDAYLQPSLTVQMVSWGVFGVVFPLLFFRFSKSLWLSFDHLINPEDPTLRLVRGRRA